MATEVCVLLTLCLITEALLKFLSHYYYCVHPCSNYCDDLELRKIFTALCLQAIIHPFYCHADVIGVNTIAITS